MLNLIELYRKTLHSIEHGPDPKEEKQMTKRMKIAYRQLKKRREKEKRETPEDHMGKVIKLHPSIAGGQDGHN